MKFKNKTLGEIVADNFRASQVFQRYNIDFCCAGKRGFIEACIAAKLDPEVVEREILNFEQDAAHDIDYNAMQPDKLIDFILREHHQYIEAESRSLPALADKVAQVHRDKHPELVEVAQTVHLIMEDMLVHQRKEEEILFPYIKAMVESKKNGTALPEACFGNIANPIGAMEADHDHVGALIFRLKELTSDFTLPDDACSSYTTLYKRLEELQNNTFRHVHLENNILFKEALKM